MSSRREMPRFIAPPQINGNSYTAKSPLGERAVTVTNGAVVEIKLTGDVFRAPPDGAGNNSTADYMGDVVLELNSDGDDIAWLVGPSGGGAAGPTYKGAGPIAPAFAQSATAGSGIVYNKERILVTFQAGAADRRHDSIYAVARATGSVLHYRVVSTLPGAA